MFVLRKVLLWSLLLLPVEILADDISKALVYPENIITNPRPWVIWQDRYCNPGVLSQSEFRITIKSGSKDSSQGVKYRTYTLRPRKVYDQFYAFKLPRRLTAGNYGIKIEKLHRRRSVGDRRYYYERYPAKRNFILNPQGEHDPDFLEPRFYIAYHSLARERYFRGYDALLSSISATAAGGAGLAIYHFFGESTWGKVLAGVCFLSAGFGYGTSIYYTGKYFSSCHDMAQVLNLGRASSGKVSPDAKALRAKFDLKF